MKKLVMILLTLFITYIGLRVIFKTLNNGDDSVYTLESNGLSFEIQETSYFKEDIHNYLYEIIINETSYKFQIFEDFDKNIKIIEDVKYYKDSDYECILPIFKGKKTLTDIICLKDGLYNYYHNIQGVDKLLDEYVDTLNIYDINSFKEDEEIVNINDVLVYKNNLIKDHYVGITNYKGIYNISSNFNSLIYNISLFTSDVYNQKLGVFVNEYYVAPDYDVNHEFNEIKIIDLVNLKVERITVDSAISFDSYIQGVVDNNIYLYDKENKKQHQIDIYNKIITSSNEIKYYKNGSWTLMSVMEANNETKFTYNLNEYENDDYIRIDKVGTDVGYYYLYKKNGSTYDVYRVNIQNQKGLTYLFNTKTIDKIYYVDDYVYFINQNTVQVFNEGFGVRSLIRYEDLEFNKYINFNIYVK